MRQKERERIGEHRRRQDQTMKFIMLEVVGKTHLHLPEPV